MALLSFFKCTRRPVGSCYVVVGNTLPNSAMPINVLPRDGWTQSTFAKLIKGHYPEGSGETGSWNLRWSLVARAFYFIRLRILNPFYFIYRDTRRRQLWLRRGPARHENGRCAASSGRESGTPMWRVTGVTQWGCTTLNLG